MTDNLLVADARALSTVLRRLDQLGGQTPGPATWRTNDDGELSIEWKGGTEVVTVRGGQRFSFHVLPSSMRALVETLSGEGSVSLGLRFDGRVTIDGLLLDHRPVGRESAQNLLPVRATPYDVLRLAYTHDAETIERAGLAADLAITQERLVASIEEAARDLAWLRINPELLATWVNAHLGARGEGQISIEVGCEEQMAGDASSGVRRPASEPCGPG